MEWKRLISWILLVTICLLVSTACAFYQPQTGRSAKVSTIQDMSSVSRHRRQTQWPSRYTDPYAVGYRYHPMPPTRQLDYDVLRNILNRPGDGYRPADGSAVQQAASSSPHLFGDDGYKGMRVPSWGKAYDKMLTGTSGNKKVSHVELEEMLGNDGKEDKESKDTMGTKTEKVTKPTTKKTSPKTVEASHTANKEVVTPVKVHHDKTSMRKRGAITHPAQEENGDDSYSHKKLLFRLKIEQLKTKLLHAEVNELLSALDLATSGEEDEVSASETRRLQNALNLELLQDRIDKITGDEEEDDDDDDISDETVVGKVDKKDKSETETDPIKTISNYVAPPRWGEITLQNNDDEPARVDNDVDPGQEDRTSQYNVRRCPAVRRYVTGCRFAKANGIKMDEEATDLCNRHELCYACAAVNGGSREQCDHGYLSTAVGDCSKDRRCIMGARFLLAVMRKQHDYNEDMYSIVRSAYCRDSCVSQFVMEGGL